MEEKEIIDCLDQSIAKLDQKQKKFTIDQLVADLRMIRSINEMANEKVINSAYMMASCYFSYPVMLYAPEIISKHLADSPLIGELNELSAYFKENKSDISVRWFKDER